MDLYYINRHKRKTIAQVRDLHVILCVPNYFFKYDIFFTVPNN